MSIGFDTAAFDRGTDELFQVFTREQAQKLVELHGSEGMRQRIEELAERNTEGELSPAEFAEYQGYVKANQFIAILQAKARKFLAAS